MEPIEIGNQAEIVKKNIPEDTCCPPSLSLTKKLCELDEYETCCLDNRLFQFAELRRILVFLDSVDYDDLQPSMEFSAALDHVRDEAQHWFSLVAKSFNLDDAND